MNIQCGQYHTVTTGNTMIIDNVSLKSLSEDNNIDDQIFADTTSDICKTRILTYSEPQTGEALGCIETFAGIDVTFLVDSEGNAILDSEGNLILID